MYVLNISIVLYSLFVRCYCKLEPFVVGGEYATIKDFPHVVYLSVQCNYRWSCGASILNQRIIVTAAHCLDGCSPRKYSTHFIDAYAGHENIDETTAERSIVYYKNHPYYDEISVANDIGLGLVERSFPLGANIKRVIVLKTFSTGIRKGKVAGWGIIDDDTHEQTGLLKSVRQRIRSPEVCALIGFLHPGMYCAGSTNVTADHPARGDSGSGMVTSRFEEIGLVSFRVNKLPALMVYTNLTYYYRWIQTNSKGLYCEGKK